MVLSTIQNSLLILIALLGIPAGYYLKSLTKEEMKDGEKWFQILGVLAIITFITSLTLLKGEVLALLLTISSFIFFISTVPLLRKVK